MVWLCTDNHLILNQDHMLILNQDHMRPTDPDDDSVLPAIEVTLSFAECAEIRRPPTPAERAATEAELEAVPRYRQLVRREAMLRAISLLMIEAKAAEPKGLPAGGWRRANRPWRPVSWRWPADS